MNQLYKIGIIVAVLLLILLGFTKITNRDNSSSNIPDFEIQEMTDEETQNTLQDNETTVPMEGQTTVVMKTNKGDVTIELFTQDMPITAANFLKLAQEDF